MCDELPIFSLSPAAWLFLLLIFNQQFYYLVLFCFVFWLYLPKAFCAFFILFDVFKQFADASFSCCKFIALIHHWRTFPASARHESDHYLFRHWKSCEFLRGKPHENFSFYRLESGMLLRLAVMREIGEFLLHQSSPPSCVLSLPCRLHSWKSSKTSTVALNELLNFRHYLNRSVNKPVITFYHHFNTEQHLAANQIDIKFTGRNLCYRPNRANKASNSSSKPKPSHAKW